MSDAASLAAPVLWGGLALGAAFGAVAQRSNFCTMGALSDIVNMGHWGRARMWLLAVAVGLAGAALLHHLGLVNLAQSIYRRSAVLPWLSLLVGGLVFGVGMTLAGGCANKNLLRVGGGSLRSLVVLLVMAVSAYMTLKGLFGQWRVGLLDPVSVDLRAVGLADPSLAALLALATGVPAATAGLAASLVLSVAILAFVLADRRFRGNVLQLASGVVLGLLVVGGWYVTGHLGFGENPETLEQVYFATNTRTLESMSFVAPTAFSLELLMLWTDKSLRVTFGIATIGGVVLGSLIHAVTSRQFLWEGFASLADLRNQLTGGILMGFGGVLAMGCTIGQGLSGVSTLALGSFISVAGIVAGSVATMKWQER